MKCFILLLFLLIILQLTAQRDTMLDDMSREIKAGSQSVDSMIAETKRMNAAMDSSMNTYNRQMTESAIRRDSAGNAHNLDAFLNERKEQEQKENRNLIIRTGFIGFAVALGVILYARRRRNKKKKV